VRVTPFPSEVCIQVGEPKLDRLAQSFKVRITVTMAMRQAAHQAAKLWRLSAAKQQNNSLALRFARGYASDPAASGSSDIGYVSQV